MSEGPVEDRTAPDVPRADVPGPDTPSVDAAGEDRVALYDCIEDGVACADGDSCTGNTLCRDEECRGWYSPQMDCIGPCQTCSGSCLPGQCCQMVCNSMGCESCNDGCRCRVTFNGGAQTTLNCNTNSIYGVEVESSQTTSTVICQSGASCHVTCSSQTNVVVDCQPNSQCYVDTGVACAAEVHCRTGSNCEIAAHDISSMNASCEGDGFCMLRCSAEASHCLLDCNGDAGSLPHICTPLGESVCNRSCP